MKKIKVSLISLIYLFLAGCYISQPVPVATAPAPPPEEYAQQAPPPQASYQTFYDELAPYGTWVSEPRYGYVWLPNAGPDFRPYVTEGYWAYSDAGWTWVSYYNWGWAPFHYGRWTSEPGYGWMWIPGNDWAPAWVTWGNYNGYYGWAPLEPGYQIGAVYNPPISYWCFTEPRYMGDRAWSNHYYTSYNSRISMGGNAYVENVNNITIINNTSNYNSRVYNAGPRRQEIENTTRTPIQTVQLRENNSPGKSDINNGSLNIYRPRMNGESRTGNNVKPSTVVPLENMRQGERTPTKQEQRTPDLNRENQNQQITPRPEPTQEPNRIMQRQPEPPSNSQQQRVPVQENNQTPAQQQQQGARTPVEQKNPTVQRPGNNQLQPPRQVQSGNGGRRTDKVAKQPKNKQVAKPAQKDNTSPERIEKK